MKSKIHKHKKNNFKLVCNKSIIMFAFAIATFTFVSCKGEAKDETTEEHAGHDHEAGEMNMAGFTCPMDCEKGKIYDEAGKCPVCEMDLVEFKDAHEGHDHPHPDGPPPADHPEDEAHDGHDH